MTARAREILELALALPRDEREAFAVALSDSLNREPSRPEATWTAEVGVRVEALEGDVDAKLGAWRRLQRGVALTLSSEDYGPLTTHAGIVSAVQDAGAF